jgi:hypothetical protein
MVNLEQVAWWLGFASLIGGCLLGFYKLFARFEKLEKQAAHRKTDTEIMLETMLGILDGLIENGCNGPVKEARKRLIDYMAENR